MAIQIVSREEWGAAPPKSTPRKIAIPTPELWLHHTASPSGGAERVRQIQAFHQGPSREWNDIAYSFLVNHEGTVYEGRGVGIAGGHTKDHNTISHAICVMGHYDQIQPSQKALDAVVELARHGHDQGWWPQLFTGGHRDASGANTSCPGKNLYSKLPAINGSLREDDMPLTDEDIAKVALAVANLKVTRGTEKVSWIQETADSKTLLLLMRQDSEHLNDAELDNAVNNLLNSLPQKVLDLLKAKL